MKRAEAENLLGGYATGTLTEGERRLLFGAALADQELFDLLADEEALRDLLADSRVRRRLLDALAGREAGVWERLREWWRRPVAWGLAGSLAVAALLVVMLAPVYQTTKRPVVRPVAQAPVEMAKKAEPAVRAAPAGRLAAERRREKVEAAAEQRAEGKQALAEPESKPKLEAARRGVVGGVVAAAPQAAALEADARTLYNAQEAEQKGVSATAFRMKRAADIAAAPSGPVGMRYTILKQAASGEYTEVAPDIVFAAGDVVRLSVEANQSGIIRLSRQGAAGGWSQVAEMRVEARVRQVIPAEGLRLEASQTLVLELTRGEGLAAAGKPTVQRAADERAVYVVDAGGGPLVRTEIQLTVR